MTSSKSTKRALLTSTFAIFMCIAMLIGTTFAWFTDTASTAVNRIESGSLKVGFEYWDGTQYTDATNVNLFSENTRWEPGHTEVVYLKISNQGSLALKYRLSTINTFEYQGAKNSKGETIQLSKYLEIGIAEGRNVATEGVYATRDEAVAAAAKNMVSYDSYTKDSTLTPATGDNESADYIAFIVHMPETVGNEANSANGNAAWIRFNLALTATQVSYESDSFGPDYDDGIPYPIIGANEAGTGTVLYNELKNRNPNILLGGDAKYGYGWYVNYKTTLNLNGHSLSNTYTYDPVLTVEGNADLTITGNGTINPSKNVELDTIRVKGGAKLTIESGTFIGNENSSCIYDGGGEIVIKGGFFRCNGPDASGKYYVLNQNNTTHGTITVIGGTFVNYDPSTGDDYLGGNFVPDDYKVISETQPNGDIWYTVVAK